MIKEIHVLGRKVKIENVSETELLRQLAKEKESLDESVLGFYSSSEKTIYIWSGLEEDVYKETLIHEITHAVLDVSGLTQILENNLEEAICVANESFVSLFKNKKFVEAMQD